MNEEGEKGKGRSIRFIDYSGDGYKQPREKGQASQLSTKFGVMWSDGGERISENGAEIIWRGHLRNEGDRSILLQTFGMKWGIVEGGSLCAFVGTDYLLLGERE